MSECEICGREVGMRDSQCRGVRSPMCYRLGYERTLARADRYQAEFSACKALLIAEQKRAERAEAERAEGRAACDAQSRKLVDERDAAEQRASEARVLALRDAASLAGELVLLGEAPEFIAQRIRALAALPVEPVRRQVTENANALGAPAAGCSEEDR